MYIQKDKFLGLEKYEVCRCLSVGGFSKVFLLRSNADGCFYAGKFIDKKKEKNKHLSSLFTNEKFIHSSLSNQFIVNLHEFIETSQFYVFIMEYCPGGELFHLLKNATIFSEPQARFYII